MAGPASRKKRASGAAETNVWAARETGSRMSPQQQPVNEVMEGPSLKQAVTSVSGAPTEHGEWRIAALPGGES